jgi:hypothetical protein
MGSEQKRTRENDIISTIACFTLLIDLRILRRLNTTNIFQTKNLSEDTDIVVIYIYSHVKTNLKEWSLV